ncbi:MAG: hypothetical protein QNK03_23190 [Myxococcota bacterium]|nr:hypothetical protein [Myxococcota bacterium]
MDEQTFDLRDLKRVFRRHLRKMIVVAETIFLISIVLAAVLPNTFQASTTLLVEPQTISRKLVEGGLDQGDITNRLHLMTMQILSRPRLSRIIDDLGLYAEESEEMTREEIIEYMRSKIEVQPVLPELVEETLLRRSAPEINTFRLKFRDSSAQTAAAVANRLAGDFIDEHIRERIQVSGDTAEFIESELARLAGRIREIEAQIAQVKAENSGSLPEELDANQRALQRAVDEMRLAQFRLTEAQSDEAFYGQQSASLVVDEARTGVVGDVTSPALRLRLLEMDLSELRARGFTDKHPDVVATTIEMEALRERLLREEEDDDPLAGRASAAQQVAEAQTRRAALRADAAAQEIDRLQQQIGEINERLAATPRVAEQLDALERSYLHLSGSFQEFSEKRLDAAVASNMERRQKGEQFRVLESAYPPPSPVSPNRPLIVVTGLLLGILMGVAVGVLLTAADSSYSDPSAVQNSLRIPVLASIPGILLDADRRALRRRRVRELAAALLVAGVTLTGAAAGYVYLNMPHLLAGDDAESRPEAAQAAGQAG